MREPYIEGLAIHGGPESCVVVREDAGEALTGVRAGRAIEPRNQGDRGADAVNYAEGNIAGGAIASRSGPCAVGEPGMHGISMRENREIPRSPARLIAGRAAQGRPRPQS